MKQGREKGRHCQDRAALLDGADRCPVVLTSENDPASLAEPRQSRVLKADAAGGRRSDDMAQSQIRLQIDRTVQRGLTAPGKTHQSALVERFAVDPLGRRGHGLDRKINPAGE